ncbi:MAG: helix-turn-helix transcriptional regulator [Clostridia bacterium]|nr:helix-turn-helix transcriptional regulator [Clostridia bacterium]
MTSSPETPYEAFGQKLTALRKAAGMSRQQLGDLCGIAQSTVVNYERGLRVPYADTAVRMARAFGLSVEELLSTEEDAVTPSVRGAERLRFHLSEAGSALSGGELSEDQLEEYVLEIQKMAMAAQQRLREMHAGKQRPAGGPSGGDRP